MSINILFLIVIAVLVVYGIRGFKLGLIEGATQVISCVIGLIALGAILKLIGTVTSKNWVNVVIMLMFLWIIRKIDKLLQLILGSLKLVAKIPVVSWVNKLAGVVFGAARGLCFIWIAFAILSLVDYLNISTWMATQISENTYLQIINESNLILRLIRNIV